MAGCVGPYRFPRRPDVKEEEPKNEREFPNKFLFTVGRSTALAIRLMKSSNPSLMDIG